MYQPICKLVFIKGFRFAQNWKYIIWESRQRNWNLNKEATRVVGSVYIEGVFEKPLSSVWQPGWLDTQDLEESGLEEGEIAELPETYVGLNPLYSLGREFEELSCPSYEVLTEDRLPLPINPMPNSKRG